MTRRSCVTSVTTDTSRRAFSKGTSRTSTNSKPAGPRANRNSLAPLAARCVQTTRPSTITCWSTTRRAMSTKKGKIKKKQEKRVCELCGKTIGTLSGYEKHMDKHNNPSQRFQCPVSQYEKHMDKHNNPSQRFQCP